MNRTLASAALVLSLSWVGAAHAQLAPQLLAFPAVRKDLKLTLRQEEEVKRLLATKLDLVQHRVKDTLKSPNPPRSGGAIIIPTGDIAEPFNVKISQVLSKAQIKRLDEIYIQKNGVIALTGEKVAERLNLDPETMEMIKGAIDEMNLSKRALNDDLIRRTRSGEINNGTNQSKAQREISAKSAKMERATEAAIYKLLSKKQRAKFAAMHGEPMKDLDPFEERPKSAATSAKPAAISKN